MRKKKGCKLGIGRPRVTPLVLYGIGGMRGLRRVWRY